jgi:putative hydrolase of the HAD superfamily
MTSVQGLLLDADGVVQIPPSTWRSSLEALCGEPGRAAEFLADVFAAEKPCLTGDADFESALAQVLRKWRSEMPVKDALHIWTQIEPAHDILASVRTLRCSGVVVSLATNQQAYRAKFMKNSLGYAGHFDHLLFSCELGHAKPSAEFFSTALAKIGIKPDAVLFIDDNDANVSAARSCGLQAEVFHLSEGVERFHEICRTHDLGGL